MKYLISIFFILAAASCRKESSVDEMMIAADEVVSFSPPPQLSVLDSKQVLIFGATIQLEVGNVKAINDSVKRILPMFQAYAANENSVNDNDRQEQRMEIRVVEKNFYQLVSRLESLGEKVLSREVDIQDVTEEYIDLEARLKTKRQLENRYYEILKAAKTVKDMLEIETQLGEIRGDIESMESRIKHIDSKVSFSTIRLTFSEKAKEENALGSQIFHSIESGWQNVIQFFLALLEAWPWIFLGTGCLLMFFRWRRRRFALEINSISGNSQRE